MGLVSQKKHWGRVQAVGLGVLLATEVRIWPRGNKCLAIISKKQLPRDFPLRQDLKGFDWGSGLASLRQQLVWGGAPEDT